MSRRWSLEIFFVFMFSNPQRIAPFPIIILSLPFVIWHTSLKILSASNPGRFRFSQIPGCFYGKHEQGQGNTLRLSSSWPPTYPPTVTVSTVLDVHIIRMNAFFFCLCVLHLLAYPLVDNAYALPRESSNISCGRSWAYAKWQIFYLTLHNSFELSLNWSIRTSYENYEPLSNIESCFCVVFPWNSTQQKHYLHSGIVTKLLGLHFQIGGVSCSSFIRCSALRAWIVRK